MIASEEIDELAQVLVSQLSFVGKTLSTAESITGGLISQQLTAVPGASKVFCGGIVAYSVDVKIGLLGVSQEDLAHGVVSEQVAIAMAQGALKVTDSDFAISCTGVAGPGPHEGVEQGTVWLACASKLEVTTQFLQLTGNRDRVRIQCAARALALANALVTRLS